LGSSAERRSPPGEMASQLVAGSSSREGMRAGQDGDELKTQIY